MGFAQSAQAYPANKRRRLKPESGKAGLRASKASEFPRRSLAPREPKPSAHSQRPPETPIKPKRGE